jgi:predicted deacylase
MKNMLEPKIEIIGNGKPVVVIVGGMHGDEKVGLRVFKKIKSDLIISKGTLKLITANRQALLKGARFIDSDLNRSFPGSINGGKEEQLAVKLTKIVLGCDYLLDLHACSVPNPAFCIIRGENKINLAKRTNLTNVVIFPLKKQGGRSLIDQVENGIGLELGGYENVGTTNAGFYAVTNFLSSLGMLKKRKIIAKKQSIYKINGNIYRDEGFIKSRKIKNLQLVRKGTVLGRIANRKVLAERDFYPALFGQRSYGNILSLAAERLDGN